MPSTYTLIKGETLASSAASYTFTAIPSTFTDLVVRMSVRSTTADFTDAIFVKFNNSSGSITSYTSIYADGSSAYSGRNSGTNNIYAGEMDSASSTTDVFGSAEVYIPSYTASQNKPVSSVGMAERNAAYILMRASAGLFRSTTAISEITIAPSSNLLVSGSSFYLYGIKNS